MADENEIVNISDSGDYSVDMEEYVERNAREAEKLREKCEKLKIPIEPAKYTISPLQNMRPRLYENYSEIYAKQGNEEYFPPHKKFSVKNNIRRNLIVTGAVMTTAITSATLLIIFMGGK